MSAIQFNNVSKVYRRGFTAKKVHALDGVSFTVSDHGITGFVGPNGAGKTTSIKIALGLVRPTTGEVLMQGLPSLNTHARRQTAYISEQPYLYPYLTVREHMAFFYRLMKLDRNRESREIQRALDRVELGACSARKARELSKGMQQRLNIAQSLLGDPRIFIMDEPMSGLDPFGRKLVRDLIAELSDEGRAVFFSTHVLEDIESLCDRVIALCAGRVIFDGDLSQLAQSGSKTIEIIVSAVPDTLRDQLNRHGCTIIKEPSGTIKLLVGTEEASTACQRLLHSHDIFPVTISQQMVPLEKILYPNSARMKAS